VSIRELVTEELSIPHDMFNELVQFDLACDAIKEREVFEDELKPIIGTGRKILGEINFILAHQDCIGETESVLKKLRIHLAKNLYTLTNTKFE